MKPILSRRSCVRARSLSVVISWPSIHTLPAVGLVEAGEDVHERRLAGAGRAHDRRVGAALQVDVHAGQGAHAARRPARSPARCHAPGRRRRQADASSRPHRSPGPRRRPGRSSCRRCLSRLPLGVRRRLWRRVVGRASRRGPRRCCSLVIPRGARRDPNRSGRSAPGHAGAGSSRSSSSSRGLFARRHAACGRSRGPPRPRGAPGASGRRRRRHGRLRQPRRRPAAPVADAARPAPSAGQRGDLTATAALAGALRPHRRGAPGGSRGAAPEPAPRPGAAASAAACSRLTRRHSATPRAAAPAPKTIITMTSTGRRRGCARRRSCPGRRESRPA